MSDDSNNAGIYIGLVLGAAIGAVSALGYVKDKFLLVSPDKTTEALSSSGVFSRSQQEQKLEDNLASIFNPEIQELKALCNSEENAALFKKKGICTDAVVFNLPHTIRMIRR